MKRARYQRSDARSSFVISSSRDSFGTPSVGGARVRSARGARRDGKRATGRWTRGGTRFAEKTAGIDITNGTYPPPRRRREWATCPCCWYTRIRRRSLRRGTPWRARCGSARAGCRRSSRDALNRSVAREAVGALERELVTSTQRAAGDSGAVRGGLRGGFSLVASEKAKIFVTWRISRGNFALFLFVDPPDSAHAREIVHAEANARRSSAKLCVRMSTEVASPSRASGRACRRGMVASKRSRWETKTRRDELDPD